MLHGRNGEAARLDALLDGAREGRSGALVLRGDAGIGKSALLRHAVASARATDITVVRGSGVEFEAELPYAGLELLLRRAMGSLDALPGPQRRALRAAFGLASPGASEPMFVGLAVLSLLSEHAGDGPLLCVVDDAQWLDRASTDALVFAARRLDAEGVVMLFAARDGEGAFAAPGLDELRLGGLDGGASAALLAERGEASGGAVGGAAGEAVRRRVLAQARGNPLALLELPLDPEVGRALGELPLSSRLQAAFHGRVGHLPRGTRTLLLVAAADHTGDPDTLLRALTTLGAGVADLAPAQEAGLVFVDEDDRLRFRHPLMRAAIHQRAPLHERLAAHRALADAADPVRDPDHRAWHLAAAATGPDEAVATALEATADRARERSGYAAAAAAYERAARLSTDPTARITRLLLAAESASDAANLPLSRTLSTQATHLTAPQPAPPTGPPHSPQPATGEAPRQFGAPDSATAPAETKAPTATTNTRRPTDGTSTQPAADEPPEVGAPDSPRPAAGETSTPAQPDAGVVVAARALYVRGVAEFWEGGFGDGHRMLVEGAGLVARVEPGRAARMLVQAVHTAWYLGADEVEDTVRRLAALDLPRDAPIRPVARFLSAALSREAANSPPPDLSEAVAAAGPGADPRDLVTLCGIGLALGQDAEAFDLTTALAAQSRESGAIGRLATIMFFRAEAEIFESRFADAHATASEGLRIARDTQQGQWVSQLNSTLAHIAAVRGDEARCRTHIDEALAAGSGPAMAPGAPWAHWSQGLLELGLGRAQSALDRLTLLTEPSVRHHISATRSVPDLVEAAVRLGVPERAEDSLARFEQWAHRSQQGWAQALVARCHALRAPDADAEAYYVQALDAHDPYRRPMESARTALLYGEWLRRARRKSEARGRLRTALETFERLGARPWADRARSELGATGALVTATQEGRSVAEEAGLTPQESQIVRLAARGLSNKDIAAQLFLSPRTVGYHLYKAYPKLGIVSRGQLPALFS